MMDFYEILLIGVVALLVLKPEDVPQALYHLGKVVRKLRLLILSWQAKGRDLMEAHDIQAYAEEVLKDVKDNDSPPPKS